MGPVFRLFAQSRQGKRVEIGCIWERKNRKGEPYYALTLNTGHVRWYANLGR